MTKIDANTHILIELLAYLWLILGFSTACFAAFIKPLLFKISFFVFGLACMGLSYMLFEILLRKL